MLKLLLVCACIDIGFEVGFSEDEDKPHGNYSTLVDNNYSMD
jgi:hypothetical protein